MKDITGQKFGRLLVLNYSHTNSDKKACFSCICDCGKTVIVSGKNMRTGTTKSCGCLYKEIIKQRATKHGECVGGKTPEYHIWRAIIERCTNPNHKSYADYGGRGITICDEWRNDFKAFIENVGRRPFPKYWLDRRNNSKGYEPGNMKWVTVKEQQRNKRSNTILAFNGKSMPVVEWAELLGIRATTISQRIYRKWNVERILTTL